MMRNSFRMAFCSLAVLLLGLAATQLPAQTRRAHYIFRPVTIVAGGYIPGLVADPTVPGLIYAQTDIGGVYRWEHREHKWVQLLDFLSPGQYNLMGPASIALDPTNPNRLYIAAGMYAYPGCCAFLVSNDRGRHFHIYPAPFEMASNYNGRAAGQRLAVNPFQPNQLFMGTRFNGLWVSNDRARTWKQVTSFPITSSSQYGVQWVVFDPHKPGTIYAGAYTTSTVYVSTNDGATWSALPDQPLTWPASYNVPSGTHSPAPERAIFGADGNLYVTFDDQPGPNVINYGLVEKYNPSTETWTNITPPIDSPFQSAPRGGFVGITQSPSQPGTIAVSTMDRWYPVDTVYLSRDGGNTWFNLGKITSSAGDDGPPYGNYYFNPSVYTPISPYLTFGDTNYPNSPYPSAKFGWWISAVLIDPANPNHLLYATGATIYGTRNLSNAYIGAAPTWHVEAKGIEETAVLALISPKAGPHLLSGVGDIGGFVHTNFRQSPQSGMYTNPVATSVGSLDWAGLQPSFIVRAQSPASYSTSPCNFGAYSTDSGTSWKPFPTCASGVGYSYNGGVVSVDASGTTIMWSPGSSSSTAQFSTNDGSTWTPVTGLPDGARVYAGKVTPETFYSYDNGAFYKGTVDPVNGMAAFSEENSALPASSGCHGSGCGVVDVNWAKAGNLWLPLGSNGLYHSTNGGLTWKKVLNVSDANSVSVGAAPPHGRIQAVFLCGQASHGALAIYRSDNNGASWVRISNNRHQYGGPTLIQADPRVYGRVYLGMNGRGIIYGEPAGNYYEHDHHHHDDRH